MSFYVSFFSQFFIIHKTCSSEKAKLIQQINIHGYIAMKVLHWQNAVRYLQEHLHEDRMDVLQGGKVVYKFQEPLR